MLPRNFRGGEVTHSIGNFVAGPNYHCVLITSVPKHFQSSGPIGIGRSGPISDLLAKYAADEFYGPCARYGPAHQGMG